MNSDGFPDGFDYYVVEHAFVVRIGKGSTERLSDAGVWVDYPERWRVLSEGRLLDGAQAARAAATRLYSPGEK